MVTGRCLPVTYTYTNSLIIALFRAPTYTCPSGCTMALGLTQPLTEISTRDVWMSPGGKDSRCVGLKVLQPSGADCLEILGASDCWNRQVLSGL